ncbi:hypothetical protein L596_022654 [Steinernema carpocapsae]|uniref:Uncharacterized protein n=1 Tax=Steinernema carpocapsae TaxID=34508 RepID=A0A4U5MME0_STECR|nr:hypothetical protein L596_022654 [Steinernema carpocapsae]
MDQIEKFVYKFDMGDGEGEARFGSRMRDHSIKVGTHQTPTSFLAELREQRKTALVTNELETYNYNQGDMLKKAVDEDLEGPERPKQNVTKIAVVFMIASLRRGGEAYGPYAVYAEEHGVTTFVVPVGPWPTLKEALALAGNRPEHVLSSANTKEYAIKPVMDALFKRIIALSESCKTTSLKMSFLLILAYFCVSTYGCFPSGNKEPPLNTTTTTAATPATTTPTTISTTTTTTTRFIPPLPTSTTTTTTTEATTTVARCKEMGFDIVIGLDWVYPRDSYLPYRIREFVNWFEMGEGDGQARIADRNDGHPFVDLDKYTSQTELFKELDTLWLIPENTPGAPFYWRDITNPPSYIYKHDQAKALEWIVDNVQGQRSVS